MTERDNYPEMDIETAALVKSLREAADEDSEWRRLFLEAAKEIERLWGTNWALRLAGIRK